MVDFVQFRQARNVMQDKTMHNIFNECPNCIAQESKTKQLWNVAFLSGMESKDETQDDKCWIDVEVEEEHTPRHGRIEQVLKCTPKRCHCQNP